MAPKVLPEVAVTRCARLARETQACRWFMLAVRHMPKHPLQMHYWVWSTAFCAVNGGAIAGAVAKNVFGVGNSGGLVVVGRGGGMLALLAVVDVPTMERLVVAAVEGMVVALLAMAMKVVTTEMNSGINRRWMLLGWPSWRCCWWTCWLLAWHLNRAG